MAFLRRDNPNMDIAKIIAYNISALMETNPSLDTLIKVSKAANVGFGTVRRAKNGDGNITVGNLEMIASAFRKTARDLLVEPMESYPAAGPIQAAPVAEPPRDERELLQGYRDASEEVQEIMLELARKATKKKDFELRSEKND